MEAADLGGRKPEDVEEDLVGMLADQGGRGHEPSGFGVGADGGASGAVRTNAGGVEAFPNRVGEAHARVVGEEVGGGAVLSPTDTVRVEDHPDFG